MCGFVCYQREDVVACIGRRDKHSKQPVLELVREIVWTINAMGSQYMQQHLQHGGARFGDLLQAVCVEPTLEGRQLRSHLICVQRASSRDAPESSGLPFEMVGDIHAALGTVYRADCTGVALGAMRMFVSAIQQSDIYRVEGLLVVRRWQRRQYRLPRLWMYQRHASQTVLVVAT